MNTKGIIKGVKTIFKKSKKCIIKHSPEILLWTGIAGGVGTTIIACKGTTKLQSILDKRTEDLEIINTGVEAGEIKGVKYTPTDGINDAKIINNKTILSVAKIYAPAAITGTLSIVSLLASNRIMRKRNVALVAAYAALDKSYKEYRKRVVETYGEDVDKQMRYGTKVMKIQEVVKDENGNEKVIEKEKLVSEGKYGESEFARFLDEVPDHSWEGSDDKIEMLMSGKQWYLNDILKIRGHVFLNEVYDELGLTRNTPGSVVGWMYKPQNAEAADMDRDNEIILTWYRVNEPQEDGTSKSRILVDFNVDGVIYDLI